MNRTKPIKAGTACVLAAILFTPTAVIAQAADGPSLQVTLRWIEEKIRNHTIYDYPRYNNHWSVSGHMRIKFSRCEAKYSRLRKWKSKKKYPNPMGKVTKKHNRLHPYVNIDYNNGKINLHGITDVTVKKNVIKLKIWHKSSWGTNTYKNGKVVERIARKGNSEDRTFVFYNTVERSAPDAMMARRVAKAFRHAIALCRKKKKEPF